MIHEYQKLYINEKLERNVAPSEVEAYYLENKENFQLRQNIIKCRYVKLAKEAPRINVFKRLFISNNDKQLEELRSYCYQYATTFHLDTTWVNFDEVIVNTPMVTIDNKIQFLRRTDYYETSDDTYQYFLKIVEYRISDEISPLEWVYDDIVRIIINKRKVELAKELEVYPSIIDFHFKKFLDMGVIEAVGIKDGKFISFHRHKPIVFITPVGREKFYMWKNPDIVVDIYRLLITYKKSMIDPSIIDIYNELIEEFDYPERPS